MTESLQNRWKSLLFVCISLLIISLDNTVLNVALPSIASEMNASASELQWIVDAYILVFAALLLTMGIIGDRIGRKRVLQIGIAWFGIGSLIAGFAQSTTMLIASRAFLGIGGAMVMPSTLSIITATFRDPKERSKAIGIWAGVFGIGSGIGPLVGGLLVEQFSWNAVFFINLPVVVIALIGGWFTIAESRDSQARPIDFLGVALSIVGLFALVYGIIEAGILGWTEQNVQIALLAAAILLTAFIIRQGVARYPMLPLRFFGNPSFSIANAVLVLVMFAMYGTLFFLTQYLQSVLGFSAANAGLLLLPISLFVVVGSILSSRLSNRFNVKWTVTLGVGMAAVGLFGLSVFAEVDTNYMTIAPALAIFAMGLGIGMPAATDSVMASVPPNMAGIGSAMNDTTRQLGAALGIAVLGTLANTHYLSSITKADLTLIPQDIIEGIRVSLQNAHIIAAELDASLAEQVTSVANTAFVTGMNQSLTIAAITLAVAALASAVILPTQVRQSQALEIKEKQVLSPLAGD